MEQQRGRKRPMIENDYPVAQGYQMQQHYQQPAAIQDSQIRLNQPGLSQPNETQSAHQNFDARSSLGRPNYEPGKGALLVDYYLHVLRNGAKDNNQDFWKTFVGKFFATDAKYRLCISNISVGPPKGKWRCDLCNNDLTDGLEVETLPFLFWIKYQSVLEELWSTDRANEYQNSSGEIILDYENATNKTVYENIRVVHKGQLRVVLTPDLKISSWNFCVRQFEDFVPKSLINTKLSQLEEAAQRCHLGVQNVSGEISAPVSQDICNRIVTPVHDLAEILKSPIDYKFGLPEKFVKYSQVAESLAGNNVKNIKDYSKWTGPSPVESLNHFQAMPGIGFALPSSSNAAGVNQQDWSSRSLSSNGVNQQDWSSRSLSSYGAASGSQEPLLKASQAGLATHNGHEESLNQFWTTSNSQPVEHEYNGDRNLVQTRWTNPIPVSSFTPSSSYSPLVNQQASGSRPLSSSYGATSCSNARLLEASFQAGLATRFRPEGFGAHMQFQQPQSSSQQVHEGGTASSWFRGRGSEAGTSEAVSNAAAATSTPAYQNDTIPILAAMGDHSNGFSTCVDGSNTDYGYNTESELNQVLLDFESLADEPLI